MHSRRKTHGGLHHLDAEVLVETKFHQSFRTLHRILNVLKAACWLVASRARCCVLESRWHYSLSGHRLGKWGTSRSSLCSSSAALVKVGTRLRSRIDPDRNPICSNAHPAGLHFKWFLR